MKIRMPTTTPPPTPLRLSGLEPGDVFKFLYGCTAYLYLGGTKYVSLCGGLVYSLSNNPTVERLNGYFHVESITAYKEC